MEKDFERNECSENDILILSSQPPKSEEKIDPKNVVFDEDQHCASNEGNPILAEYKTVKITFWLLRFVCLLTLVLKVFKVSTSFEEKLFVLCFNDNYQTFLFKRKILK